MFHQGHSDITQGHIVCTFCYCAKAGLQYWQVKSGITTTVDTLGQIKNEYKLFFWVSPPKKITNLILFYFSTVMFLKQS